jgi:hypothetical protein
MRRVVNLIAEIEQDRRLDDPARLRERVEALYLLDAYPVGLNGAAPHDRARAIRARLEAVDSRLFRAIRARIRRGEGADALLAWAAAPARDGRVADPTRGDGYDHLDMLVGGVLRFRPPAGEAARLAPEMVPYQPTPARHIFDMLGRAGLTAQDVLVDLGSGLGHVPLLASICTGARGIGIELEPAYVDCARRSAQGLSLTDVTFVQQDAREADLARGTVFYLYTPFTGTILRAVLDALRREAAGREIRVCAYGPCTPIVADEPWLEPVGAVETHRVAVLRSHR